MGTAILPPFSSPIGRIGMTICFDVSQMRITYQYRDFLPSFQALLLGVVRKVLGILNVVSRFYQYYI